MEAAKSLMELLNFIEDPRRVRGKRHPLKALLGLAVVAMLSGQNSYEGIGQFGKGRGWESLRQLWFTTRLGLSKATYSRVFRRIDIDAFEAAVAAWVVSRLPADGTRHVAIDGKTARATRDAGTPAAHLVSGYTADLAAVLGQLRVDAKTNDHKAALELLGVIPLGGRVVTGDAMFTHRDVCSEVIERGGDYVLIVKDNQPNLLSDIKAAFAEPPRGPFPPSRRRSGPRPSTGPSSSTRATAGGRSGP
jgi:DDE_Tnp_1-associated/Transposase DDE domain